VIVILDVLRDVLADEERVGRRPPIRELSQTTEVVLEAPGRCPHGMRHQHRRELRYVGGRAGRAVRGDGDIGRDQVLVGIAWGV